MNAPDFDVDLSPQNQSILRLAWATDIHMNCVDGPATEAFVKAMRQGGDVVLLGGDISESHDVCDWLERLGQSLERPICFVLGNHDYYMGDIEGTRGAVASFADKSPAVTWLGAGQVVKLGPSTALVGHGGWGDARLGDFMGTPVRLNDHRLIKDLSGLPRAVLKQRLHDLGTQAADALSPALERAARWAEHVLVLTHVPPFLEACWHEGQISGPQWAADFTCQATGDALLQSAAAHPNVFFEVLCGHTHSPGHVSMRPNLKVITAGAVYGHPKLAATIAVRQTPDTDKFS